MAEEKDAEAIPDERMARRIDEDPEFEEAKALLEGSSPSRRILTFPRSGCE